MDFVEFACFMKAKRNMAEEVTLKNWFEMEKDTPEYLKDYVGEDKNGEKNYLRLPVIKDNDLFYGGQEKRSAEILLEGRKTKKHHADKVEGMISQLGSSNDAVEWVQTAVHVVLSETEVFPHDEHADWRQHPIH